MSLERYIELLSDLKPNRSGGRASPHKACLLLAVIDLIDEGVLTDNRIPFDTSLKDAFSAILGVGDKDNPPPLFLTSQASGITRSCRAGIELDSRLASGMLRLLTRRKAGADAMLDDDLYQLLQVDGNRVC